MLRISISFFTPGMPGAHHNRVLPTGNLVCFFNLEATSIEGMQIDLFAHEGVAWTAERRNQPATTSQLTRLLTAPFSFVSRSLRAIYGRMRWACA